MTKKAKRLNILDVINKPFYFGRIKNCPHSLAVFNLYVIIKMFILAVRYGEMCIVICRLYSVAVNNNMMTDHTADRDSRWRLRRYASGILTKIIAGL